MKNLFDSKISINKRIINVLVIVSFLFLVLVGYITYFEFAMSEKIKLNPYNRRQFAAEDKVLRGKIYDRNGIVIANSVFEEKTSTNSPIEKVQTRNYPFGNLYCHVIGYCSRVYGKNQIEMQYNKALLGINDIASLLNLDLSHKEGNDIVLTIDHRLQTIVSKHMKDRRGAFVALNPKTGEILAMCSKPDFDPNSDKLYKNWQNIIDNEDSPLINRVTSGLYPAGSIYKIVTSVPILENNLEDEIFDDTGSFKINNTVIKNFGGGVYGKISLDSAFTFSSNAYFCYMGSKLGENSIKQIAERFLFNKSLDFELPYNKSIFPTGKIYSEQSAMLSIGQGDMLSSPLQMALVTSVIANDGKMPRPYMIKYIKNPNGITIFEQRPSILGSVISTQVAERIKYMMFKSVESGTSRRCAIPKVKIAGKTGTAENEKKGKEHTWFACFLPDKDIAITMISENTGGCGGVVVAPIVREILEEYLKNT